MSKNLSDVRGRVVAIVVIIAALIAGTVIRVEVAKRVRPYRVPADITNGFGWGNQVLSEGRALAGRTAGDLRPLSWPEVFRGYAGLYDSLAANGWYGLDYPPLRLLVMASWAKWIQQTYPAETGYREEFAWPLLWLNGLCDLASAGMTACIVFTWTIKEPIFGDTGNTSDSHCGTDEFVRSSKVNRHAWNLALAAGLLFWFNPSTIVDAYGVPQWDIWILPCYLLAIILALRDRWLAVGVALGVGVMLKGQLLLVASVFLFWPLFMGRFDAAGRISAGFAFIAAALTSPWLVRGGAAWLWVALVGAAAMISFAINAKCHRRRWRFGAAVAGVGRRANRSTLLPWLAMSLTAAVVSAAVLFHGSWTWIRPFRFGIHPWFMASPGVVANLPGFLHEVFGWKSRTVLFRIGQGGLRSSIAVQVRMVLFAVFVTTLLACAWGAASHSRRNSPRCLVSLTAPWLLFYVFLPQMHVRYLFWAAALSLCWVAASRRLLWIWAALACVSTYAIAERWASESTIGHVIERIRPTVTFGATLTVLVSTAIVLAIAIMPHHPETSISPSSV